MRQTASTAVRVIAAAVIARLSLLDSRLAAVLEYFLRDLDASVLEIHDRVRYLDADRIHDGLDVKGAVQPLTQYLKVL